MQVCRAIDRILSKYQEPGNDWILAFSGGKDSTALLLLTIAALKRVKVKNRTVTVVFCDTGVENPYISDFVKVVFKWIDDFRAKTGLPIFSSIVEPALKNTFWVKVIGKGCPPPTNRFRWCTDKLRVNPIRDFVRSKGLSEALTLTGVREQESEQRSRTIAKYTTGEEWILRYYDTFGRRYFCPILDYKTEEVWSVLHHNIIGNSEWSLLLERVYGIFSINGEVDIRTGCWTCTVIRKDHAAQQLVDRGHIQFRHLMEFRDWLVVFRDKPEYRCRKRRNTMKGPGPITIEGRNIILQRLFALQRVLEVELITSKEIDNITILWKADIESPIYKAII